MNTGQEVQVQEEEKHLQVEGPRTVAEAEAFKVIDDLSCEQAVTRANEIKVKIEGDKEKGIRGIDDFFQPMRESAHKTWKIICNRHDSSKSPYEKAKKLYIQKAADYQKKKQEEFEEKERKNKEEAERKEREERARLAEEQRKKEAEEAKKKKEAEDREKAAKKAEREGNEKKAAEERAKADKAREAAEAAGRSAEALKEEKENVYVAPKPVQQVSRPQGMSIQTVWVPEVTDEKKVPVEWRGEIDLGRLKRAKTANPKLEVPGIRFVTKAQGAALGNK